MDKKNKIESTDNTDFLSENAYYISPDKTLYIFNNDFLDSSFFQNDSIDMIVTSPPYNVDMPYSSAKDDGSYEEYLEFSWKWLTRAYEVVASDGRMCLNVPLDKNKNGQQSIYADVLHIAKSVGWRYHSTIIWNEGNISRRTAWGSWKSARTPYVITPVETIVVLYKKYWRKKAKGISDITRDEFIEWTNGLWTFSGQKRTKIGHPAPYPVELPRRCIKLFSYVGDVILDPFLGSGTTLIACADQDRIGIGFDIDEKYCEMAKERLFKNGI